MRRRDYSLPSTQVLTILRHHSLPGSGAYSRSNFTEEQIIAALKEHEAGAKVRDLCRKLGVSEHSFYRWRSKYGGMEVSDARKLKALEEENRRLKHLAADLTLDVQMLKAVNAKKW